MIKDYNTILLKVKYFFRKKMKHTGTTRQESRQYASYNPAERAE